MTIAKAKARKLAATLLHQNAPKPKGEGMSWRTLEKEYRVAAGTLNRIANSRGEWLPKDTDILHRLGLITVRSPYGIMPRWWERTPEALAAFLHIRGNAKQLAEDTRKGQYAHRGRK